MVKETGRKLIAQNRKARHNFAIEDVFEAGLVLHGTEVKSLREGRASIVDAYGHVRDGEIWLEGLHIPEYAQGTWTNHEPRRTRKLLLHRKEIDKLLGITREKGLALIPTKIYLKDGRIKCEIAVARGKKLHDKREAERARTAADEARAEMRRRA